VPACRISWAASISPCCEGTTLGKQYSPTHCHSRCGTSITMTSTSTADKRGNSIGAFVRERPFTTTVGLWGAVLAGTGLYLYKRNIPTQLKVIQVRPITVSHAVCAGSESGTAL
jgi:hypothetical protein